MWSRFEAFLRNITLNVRREQDLDLNRRGFIAASMAFLGLAFVGSFPFAVKAVRGGEPEHKGFSPLKIAGVDELQIGESKPFAYPDENEPALLIRLTKTEYRSYHIKCTHLQCPVYWNQSTGKLTCPCHNGFFAVEDGSVLAGPPQRPLPSIDLELRKDGIYAVGVKGTSGLHKGA
jgi:arsenite oxidase small subunit